MNKIKTAAKFAHKAIIYFLVGYAPIFSMGAVWLLREKTWPEGSFGNLINELGFYWILSVAYFFMALTFYREFRESLMARLAGFQEKDEREELATAKAARHTFLLMLALQTVLLVASLTTIHLERNPDGHGMLSIGLGLDSDQHLNLSSAQMEQPVTGEPGKLEIKRWILPPNFFMVLTLLILTQIVGFRLFSRRAYRGS